MRAAADTSRPGIDHAARFDRLDRLSRRMDTAFRVPGTRFRVGWDGILGLVPGIGDTLTLLPAGWIIAESWRMGVSRPVLAQMMLNSGIDYVIGLVPVVGDLFDIGWKGNRRNVALLRRELNLPPSDPRR